MTKVRLSEAVEVRLFSKPPAEFDPKTASDRELSVYGFPRRPAGKLLAHWETVLSRRPTIITPEFAPRDRPRLQLKKSLRRAEADDKLKHNPSSNIWAGGIVEPPAGETIRWIQGAWNIPTCYPPAGQGDGSYYASSWVGIDGWGTGDVLQAGCDTHADTKNGKTAHSVSPWWEWYPAGSFWITNFPVASGDTVFCLICVDDDSVTGANIYLLNASTNVAASFAATAPKGTTLQGNSADWIIERLTDRMGSYGTVFFDSAIAGTSAGKLMAASSGFAVDMIDANGTESEAALFADGGPVRVEYMYRRF